MLLLDLHSDLVRRLPAQIEVSPHSLRLPGDLGFLHLSLLNGLVAHQDFCLELRLVLDVLSYLSFHRLGIFVFQLLDKLSDLGFLRVLTHYIFELIPKIVIKDITVRSIGGH